MRGQLVGEPSAWVIVAALTAAMAITGSRRTNDASMFAMRGDIDGAGWGVMAATVSVCAETLATGVAATSAAAHNRWME